ncbi:GntR family transcriptional regulator [Mangrovicella endophytica]|uniref:GntR family transcriptional regulator n=1 Tax=Mangrovicella endophytica TaxID=2066697 RepID=UPI0018E48CB1|nr:GntR family transcriptional regulator [Mangrovicella endophytica]
MTQREERLLRHEVYRQLHEEIISCILRPGQDLRENELAQRFAVSKSPIRDALLRLESEGLIEIHSRRGYRVKDVDAREADEIYELRLLLEREGARLAVERSSDAELDAVVEAARMSHADIRDVIGYNRRFHIALSGASGQSQLGATASRIIGQFDRFVILALAQFKVLELHELEAQHLEIARAARARDAETVDRLLVEHIGRSRNHVRSIFAPAAAPDAAPSGSVTEGSGQRPRNDPRH